MKNCNTPCALVVVLLEKKVPFSMATGNVDLNHECFPLWRTSYEATNWWMSKGR